LPTDFIIEDTDPEFAATGLRVSSTLQLHRMLTVSTGIIMRELGTLSKRMQAQVEKQLKILFGIR
jgi:mRNA interferase MazF